MLEPVEPTNDAVTKVISVGGGGGNTVEHTVRERTEGVEFFTVNTNAQVPRKTVVGQMIQTGSGITKGLGTGTDPEADRNAADGGHDILRAALEGADMVSIAADMGGDTGAGAVPIVTEVTEDLGILTVAVVIRPFNFESKKRMALTEQGIIELSKCVDSLVTVPNGELLKVLSHGVFLLDAFDAADDVLKGAIQGIAELITRSGLMSVDFADMYTVMSEMGYTMMGSGVMSSEDRAEEAAEITISSPLLEDIDLSGTRGVLVNITVGFDLRPDEFETVGNAIRAFVSSNAAVVIGASLDPDMNDELRVTIIATGVGMDKRSRITLMTNKQAQQPAMDRYQQHGMAPLTQEQKLVAKVVNGNASQTAKEPGYPDIPAFLRKQAD